MGFIKIRNNFEKKFKEDGFCWQDFNLALDEAYYSALADLLKAVEKGKIGEIDYYWNGKKVIRDKIIFTREELVNFFRFKFYGKREYAKELNDGEENE